MKKASLDASWALRVGVVGGGCSGFQYDLDFSNDSRPGDISAEFDGLKVVVDERSALYLAGTTVDYVDTFGGAGFKFLNPEVGS